MGESELQDAGPTPAEEAEQKLRWENRRLHELVRDQTQTAMNWRASFHEAQQYLALVAPHLNEVAEDSNFQRFRESV